MTLFAFGSNGSGQLGIGNSDDTSSPIQCKFNNGVAHYGVTPVHVSAGGNHSMILFSTGRLACTGNLNDNLPGGDENLSLIYDEKTFDEPVKLSSASWEVSVAVTIKDLVYTWGYGGKGELGRGIGTTSFQERSSPVDVSTLPLSGTIVGIDSGVHHTVIVLSNGEVFGWGNGRKGQLGEPSGIIWEPRKIGGFDFKVVRVVCGREFTYLVGNPQEGHHTLLGTEKWGLKTGGPDTVSGWKDIGACWASVFVLHESGRIISWGRDDHGQLAPQNLPLVKKIAVGSEHVLAITGSNKVISWGWGEHGNCGPTVDETGDVKNRWNEIPLPLNQEKGVTKEIGAGCATSWIWVDHD